MTAHKVFLSSVFKELVEYRKAVHKAIQQMDDWKCVRMEDFGARDADAQTFDAEQEDNCDVFVGLVGHCYGSRPKGDKRSFTELEYEAAREADRPRLMFFAPEDFPLPANLIEPDDNREAQHAFREYVRTERIRDTFTTPDDLARRIEEFIKEEGRREASPSSPDA